MAKQTAKKPSRNVEPATYDGSTPLPDVKQELFCILYTSNSTPAFFGHNQNCYAFAYGHKDRIDEIEALIVGPAKDRKKISVKALEAEKKRKLHMCAAAGTRLLIRDDISKRCNFLMDSLFTEEIMDRELVYVLQQRRDLPSKMTAWGHAAKLKQRIKDKLDINHTFEPIDNITYVTPGK